jgi:hypothetical protein
MNVNRPTPLVHFRNARGPQVAVKYPDQTGRHGEQRRIGRQCRHG